MEIHCRPASIESIESMQRTHDNAKEYRDHMVVANQDREQSHASFRMVSLYITMKYLRPEGLTHAR